MIAFFCIVFAVDKNKGWQCAKACNQGIFVMVFDWIQRSNPRVHVINLMNQGVKHDQSGRDKAHR